MKLDVGCGHFQRGDVNVDLYVEPTGHRSFSQDIVDDSRIYTDKTKHFICADACHLPFPDNTFHDVFSSHTIEHLHNPYDMLKELVRVSSYQIEIYCPHRYASRKAKDLHVSVFSKTWFHTAFRQLGCKVISSSYSRYRTVPVGHHYFPRIFRLPEEIHEIAIKVRK